MARSFLTKRQRWDVERAAMDLERSSFVPTWRDLGDFILPTRPRFLLSDSQRGQRRNQKIIDSTATFAADTLTAGMQSNLTNPAKPWFRLTTPDQAVNESAGAKAWLQLVAQGMNQVFARSNLYDALPQLYEDVAVFGTAAMAVLEDDDDVIRCYTYPIGSYWLANDKRMQVRVWMREFRLTVRQLVDEFGGDGDEPDWSKFSTAVKSAWTSKQFGQWIDVVHVIAPNEDYDEAKLASKHKRFTSCYYEKSSPEGTKADEVFLREEGFDEFPILVARWKVSGDDVYGTSCPGMVALGDIKQLQVQERRGAQALEKMINPPLVGPSSLQRVAVNMLPGGITYHDARDGVQGLRALHEVNFRLDELEAKQAQKRRMINQAFFADIILMLNTMDQQTESGQPRTAAEITARERERLTVLGPVLERHNTDIASPLIDRTFAIMSRKGMLPPAPPELEGMTLRVEFISVAALALKSAAVAGIERAVQFVTTIAETTQNPAVLDKWDFDQTVDVYADALGVDVSLVVPDDQVAEIRAARAKQQQQQAMTEQVEKLAPAAQQLSETDITGPNALTAMFGGQQPGAAA